MSLNNVYIYRMTHIENIPHILVHGITHKTSVNANPNFISIGDRDLISTRSNRTILYKGNDSNKTKHIRLGDQIPFYFGCRMPMLYVIQNGYNGVRRQNPDNIVYIVSSVLQVLEGQLPFYFTDGHAIDSLSACYDNSMVDQLQELIDLAATKVRDWTVERDLKRRMESEFLVGKDIPPLCILGYVCYSEESKQKLLSYGIDKSNIKIDSNRYF